MTVREQTVIDLVKEVLGPREGAHELLPRDQDPRDEYITGVLAPASYARSRDEIEAEADETSEELEGEEDQDTEVHAALPGVFSPALDPKSQPRSIGLSFSVASSKGHPRIEACATWGRYREDEGGFRREPAFLLTGAVSAEHDQTWAASEGVSLRLRTLPQDSNTWRLSFYLVNETRVREKGRPGPDRYIFQPQIRVHCCSGTRIVPVRTGGTDCPSIAPSGAGAAEDASLALLYRDRSALARGHLCGATWKDIDPERSHEVGLSEEMAPFAWPDASMLPEGKQARFSPADVRTDMVPCFPVEAPNMEWRDEYGPPPTLNPEVLAETWGPEELRRALMPLVAGYEAWISAQESITGDLPRPQQSVARHHLGQCSSAAARIRQGIEALATDPDALLSFCFANKAIALQSRWARGESIVWRPFQIAFILLNVPALVEPTHEDRLTCDLLWFPTGGGKTEAYLGLAAFTLALRRRHARADASAERSGAGVGVLSRYTLRLLTIQQFRRALGMITACEMLRVDGLESAGTAVGWRPQRCDIKESFMWGGVRFSAGLWVGGNVAPNNMLSIGPVPDPGGGPFHFYAGALDILRGCTGKDYEGPDVRLRRKIEQCGYVSAWGEPAQVLNCPCCHAILAVPDQGLGPGLHTLHFVFHAENAVELPGGQVEGPNADIRIDEMALTEHRGGCWTLSACMSVPQDRAVTARELDDWWHNTMEAALGGQVRLLATRPARPGYFILTYRNVQNRPCECDFGVYCPNPACDLNGHAWAEQVPIPRGSETAPGVSKGGRVIRVHAGKRSAELPALAGMQWQDAPWWIRGDRKQISHRIPIPAVTVDDQIYHRCPSLVVATVDKFARLAFEPKASALFGNVTHYHSRWGYYRAGAPPSWGTLPGKYRSHPPHHSKGNPLHTSVSGFLPPDLILQDELHLIEGPLGSLVGLYETAVDALCERRQDSQAIRPKYVASTATVRRAEAQAQALFARRLAQFPPWSLSADDRFFSRESEMHPLDSVRPGRLYLGICAPGKGALTPIVRVWSALLGSAYRQWQDRDSDDTDRYYTLVAYFNAIRELAGALSLFRQDIPERLEFRAGTSARELDPVESCLELSSRVNSLDLPALLEKLKIKAPQGLDAVLCTSMFGTGVDVDRLNLMVVHGQPKTTASYVQATGRVGRQSGALVVTMLRAGRPRDLDHYEFFTGYHRALHRHVEPITVTPFSPRARERGLGPVSVVLLRQARQLGGHDVDSRWLVQQRLSGAFHAEAQRMGSHRKDPEVSAIPELLEARAGQQPKGRRPSEGTVGREAGAELDRWQDLARDRDDCDRFVYNEPAMLRVPERDVVLGDPQHRSHGLGEVYHNAPQSLRDVEETTGFEA